MQLNELVRLECCVTDFTASSKAEALHKISKIMKASHVLDAVSAEQIYEGLEGREKKGSTGFTNGIAIPHCQLEGITEFAVGIVISKKGIHFDSMDKRKSHVFIVILGPEGESSSHLKLLAQVSRILKEKETVDLLIRSESKTALFECFLQNAYQEDVKTVKEQQKEKLMLLIIRDQTTLEEVTEIFVEYGIQEGLMVDADKMENLLTKIPLFLGFFNFTEEEQNYNKIVLATINENYVDALIRGFKDQFGDLAQYSGLSILVIDLSLSIGI